MTPDDAMRMSDGELAKATAKAIGLTYRGTDIGGALMVGEEYCPRKFSPAADPADAAEVEQWLLALGRVGCIETRTAENEVEVIVRFAWGGHPTAKATNVADPVAARCRCLCAIAIAVATGAQ